MKRKYEGLIILNTTGTESSVDELVSNVSKELEAEGAKLDEVQQIGRRKFAYTSRHLNYGHYVNFLFEADSDALSKIQGRLKSNGAVHQQHYQRLN